MNSRKHAYLIIAHHDPRLLQTLISLIDDVRNDIFVFIDSKSDREPFLEVKAYKSRLMFTASFDVRWGSIRQVEAEYLLFETAYAHGSYAYYHLLSGVCLPLKSQDVIHATCDRMQGTEFVGFTPDNAQTEAGIESRVAYYYPFQLHFRPSNLLGKLLFKSVRKACLLLQMRLGWKRFNKFNQLGGGKKGLQLGKYNLRFLSLPDWAKSPGFESLQPYSVP